LNAAGELRATLTALLVVGFIVTAGWLFNRGWSWILRISTALAALIVAGSIHLADGWLGVGRCLPGLMLLAFVLAAMRVGRDLRQSGRVSPGPLLALLLVLLAGAMLARMPLRARIGHFGFFQAALAGMAAAAVMVAEAPRWSGGGAAGRCLAVAGCVILLTSGGVAVERRSAMIRGDQTQPVGLGLDRFYAFGPEVDETGKQVNWCAEHLEGIPPEATLQVLPEGVVINYLSRHVRPLLDFDGKENEYVEQLSRVRPDYVVFVTRDLREYGIKNFGAPGNPGEKIMQWVRENYEVVDVLGGTARGAAILRRKR
jgi:hypothetical protein